MIRKVYRSIDGGKPMVVVSEEDRFVYLKRADSSKKQLANPSGGYLIARSEFETAWFEVPA